MLQYRVIYRWVGLTNDLTNSVTYHLILVDSLYLDSLPQPQNGENH